MCSRCIQHFLSDKGSASLWVRELRFCVTGGSGMCHSNNNKDGKLYGLYKIKSFPSVVLISQNTETRTMNFSVETVQAHILNK